MGREYAANFPSDDSLYDILQVSPGARPEVIQAAYRVLARIYHPDVSPAADADGKTRLLNAAYDILSDPGRRASYDIFRTEMDRTSASRGPSIDPTRSARTAASHRIRPSDRRTGSTVVAWVVTSCVALTIVVAILLMLWSLYDALDSQSGTPFAPRNTVGAPSQVPVAPPFGAMTPSWSR
jgi:curved DNA-binding protein CbpA